MNESSSLQEKNFKSRINKALEFTRWGFIDGNHHKMWVIDQMVRALKGCPLETRRALDVNSKEYEYEAQGESEEYRRFIASKTDDGCVYWDSGIAP